MPVLLSVKKGKKDSSCLRERVRKEAFQWFVASEQ